jgi:hypothetical protein
VDAVLSPHVHTKLELELEPERKRLVELVRVLRGVFPEDEARLGEVKGRLLRVGMKKGKRRRMGGSEAEGEGKGEGDVWDVRGRDPVHVQGGGGGGDPLIHVFVDQLSLGFHLFFHAEF